jgi:hypothetical protein
METVSLRERRARMGLELACESSSAYRLLGADDHVETAEANEQFLCGTGETLAVDQAPRLAVIGDERPVGRGQTRRSPGFSPAPSIALAKRLTRSPSSP